MDGGVAPTEGNEAPEPPPACHPTESPPADAGAPAPAGRGRGRGRAVRGGALGPYSKSYGSVLRFRQRQKQMVGAVAGTWEATSCGVRGGVGGEEKKRGETSVSPLVAAGKLSALRC
jgi:hypothetical protein